MAIIMTPDTIYAVKYKNGESVEIKKAIVTDKRIGRKVATVAI